MELFIFTVWYTVNREELKNEWYCFRNNGYTDFCMFGVCGHHVLPVSDQLKERYFRL